MKLIHLSYSLKTDQDNPWEWLSKLDFFVGVLECTTAMAEVKSVHCISYQGIITMNGVEYHFLKLKKWQLLLPWTLHSYLKNINPDAIIIHGLIFPFQIIMLRWHLGSRIKIVCQHHAERPFVDVRRHIQGWADNYIGAYLFCSFEQGMEWVKSKQIKDSGKIKEVMGTSSVFKVIDRDIAVRKTKVNGTTNYLWVGRLDNNKDPFTLVKAFLRFYRDNTEARLYMIYHTFELMDQVKSLIDKSPNGKISIFLVGQVNHEDLLYWYNSVDFIISSSHYEGSGVSVCEGLSCGCIPILTNIPSFRMMTSNGEIGLLYERGDENGLVDRLNQSLVMERDLVRQRVLQQFHEKLSFEANARQTIDVIQSLE
jgi:glycosyltransferase involved in cell wall biosynthesis